MWGAVSPATSYETFTRCLLLVGNRSGAGPSAGNSIILNAHISEQKWDPLWGPPQQNFFQGLGKKVGRISPTAVINGTAKATGQQSSLWKTELHITCQGYANACRGRYLCDAVMLHVRVGFLLIFATQ